MTRIPYLFFFFTFITNVLAAQKKDTLNVAVLMYDGVELLDFAGPAEVFAAASYYTDIYHFNVYTVARESKLKSQGFLEITSNFSFTDAPKSNILVLPGGNAGPAINDEKTQQWIGQEITDNTSILTVCSGIYFLDKPGKLNDIQVTSHHKILPFLKEQLNPENVIEDVKYVDSGNIVTSAGVSSGIEGALLMLSKIAGVEVANRTSRYMEYHQWDLGNGKITYDVYKEASNYIKSNTLKPDFGVLDIAGHIALRENRLSDALKFFQTNSRYHPNSSLSYYSLAQAKKKKGELVPPVYEDFLNVLRTEGAQKAKAIFEKTKQQHPEWVLFTLKDISVRGTNLFYNEQYKEAETVLKMGVEQYPDIKELYVQLIETQLKMEKPNEAKNMLERALLIFPKDKELFELKNNIGLK